MAGRYNGYLQLMGIGMAQEIRQEIRLVKRDPREIQSWIDAMLIKVEKFLSRFCQVMAVITVLALVKNYHPAAEIACALFIVSMGAFHDRKRIAKFLALNFTRKDLLVLKVTRQ